MSRTGPTTVTVDWTVCRGRGTCSELLPERIALDEWGYPLIDPTPVDAELSTYAGMAVDSCPTRALRLQRLEPSRNTAGPQPQHGIAADGDGIRSNLAGGRPS